MSSGSAASALSKVFCLVLAVFGVMLAKPPAAVAQASPKPGTITLELNKLEPLPPACRAYFVVSNGLKDPVRELRLDVFLFDKSGVISRRVAMTFSDIRPDRSKVVLFDLPDLACGDLSRVMVNDILACTAQTGNPLPDCASVLVTSSKAAVELR